MGANSWRREGSRFSVGYAQKGGKVNIVRWLGAFRKGGSLHNSLKWELKENRREVAAEVLVGGQSHVQAYIGLRIARGAVRKVFRGDVWSEVTARGTSLKMTRSPSSFSDHTEAFCKPLFTAIVLKGKVSKKAFKTVLWWSKAMDLPIERIRS